MNKFITLLLLVFTLTSCRDEDKIADEIAAIPVDEVTIERFDRKFFESKPDYLPQLKAEYPYLFPADEADSVWVNMLQNADLRRLYKAVQEQYKDVNRLESDLEDLFRYIKYYYPDFKQPIVVALVSDDLQTKAIYADELLLLPLSLYLGKKHQLYEGLPQYQILTYDKSQILPDVVTSFSSAKIPPPLNRTLLAQMVYYGKVLYMMDVLLPDTNEADKIAYTPEQVEWSHANEVEVWRYFVEKKLLYDANPKLSARFIKPAPFSKFYHAIDNETPGRIGQWMGWQIVRAYMKNNKDVTLQELMAADAKTIFENSKYKPKK